MKNIILQFTYFTTSLTLNSTEICCGLCTGNCNFWCIQYEVNCSGHIESFNSIHFNNDGITFNNGDSAPEWLGMWPPNLGCNTNVCG